MHCPASHSQNSIGFVLPSCWRASGNGGPGGQGTGGPGRGDLSPIVYGGFFSLPHISLFSWSWRFSVICWISGCVPIKFLGLPAPLQPFRPKGQALEWPELSLFTRQATTPLYSTRTRVDGAKEAGGASDPLDSLAEIEWRSVNFEMFFWCHRIDQKTNKIFVRIFALGS